MTGVSDESWAEFTACHLGNIKRNQRAAWMVDQLLAQAGRSVAQTCGKRKEALAYYRFASSDDLQHDALLLGHRLCTAHRSIGRKLILVPQDTTTFSFPDREPISGMGPVDPAHTVQGFFAHTALFVDPSNGEVLGVAAQEVWARSWEAAPKNETSAQRKLRTRESEHWGRVQTSVAQAFGRQQLPDDTWTSPPTEAPHLVAVFDREGDIFEAMETMQKLGHGFVIRAVRNRKLKNTMFDETLSMSAVEKSPELGRITFEVPRKSGGQPSRMATLSVRGITIELLPPKSRNRKGDAMKIGIVLIQEIDPPPGIEALCWYLITTEPCITFEDARLVGHYYRHRWKVEEFHMGLKSGCSLERAQFETLHSFKNYLATATVAAWRMLTLRDAARSGKLELPPEVLSEDQKYILRYQFPKLPLKPTAREWMRAVAMLGGFFGRKSDGEPGWRTLWWGWERLRALEQGYLLARAGTLAH